MNHVTTLCFDEARAKAFAGKMLGAINNAALALMASVATAPTFSTIWRNARRPRPPNSPPPRASPNAMCASGWPR